MAEPSELERTLHAAQAGDATASRALYEAVYAELQRLARAEMRRERNRHTLQPTALVHEAFLRLTGSPSDWKSREHLIAAAAQAMRRVLVDHARARGAEKRGGGRRATPVDLAAPEGTLPLEDLVALDEALARLEALEPRKARVVELRFFAGLGVEEVARLLDVTSRTIVQDWTYARAWLFREMSRT